MIPIQNCTSITNSSVESELMIPMLTSTTTTTASSAPNVCLMENDSGAVDYSGRPFSRSTTGGWRSSFFIIGVEIAERFAYYGIASNLITYMTGPLGKSTGSAAANVNAWSGTASMLPLLGGLLADSYFGRYRTILLASAIYILGLGMLTLSAVVPHLLHSKCITNTSEATACDPTSSRSIEILFFIAIYVVAFAQGCHKPNAQAFAADQFDENDTKEREFKSSFFNWWYCAMCVGTMAAQLIVNYVQDNISWGLGFGIPCIAMVIALIVFMLGTRTYRYYPVISKTSFPKAIQHCLILVSRHKSNSNHKQPEEKYHVETGANIIEPMTHASSCPTVNSRPLESSECCIPMEEDNKSQLKERIFKLFPIWATCLVYAVIFSQTTTLFTKQGSTMDGRIGNNFKLPPATLQIFISFTIVITIPFYDKVFVPFARKITGFQSGITMLQRIGTGQFLSVITMIVAAIVEMKRLKTARNFDLIDQPNSTIPISLWWLVPQYMIFGIADVFTIIGMQEFFYDQAPDGMRSFGLALYLSVLGIGSFVSSLLIIVIDKITGKNGDSWFSTNLNRAHIDYFYWLLAVLSGLELLLFLFFTRSYHYRKKGSIYGKE